MGGRVVTRLSHVESRRAIRYQSLNVFLRLLRPWDGAANGVASLPAFRDGPVGRVIHGRV
jgi:hypothetical protein